ncbi:Hypothetical protein PHPALM_36771 [Phytophthora palmivora]|uniref:Uncharacterized protein n=1 Tax=Phytophthora palmivora TaxID=4796 RepID=A0A2P4WZ60_9STRA|nr:Hypothetical protein PHPALM_36771 [Phytophthora palmivora]
MARQIVLLLPSDVPNEELDGPHYGEVTLRGNRAASRAQLLPKRSGENFPSVEITPDIARTRRVPAAELRSGAPGWLLYRPVVCDHEGAFLHGQVVNYGNGLLSINTRGGIVQVPYDKATEVAPVVACLLWNSQLLPDLPSLSAIEQVHTTILDRILGRDGCRASKSIARILRGFVAPTGLPKAGEILTWRCPRTGEAKPVRVGHVVEFTFYVDGDRSIPTSITLGTSYCDDPRSRNLSQAAQPTTPNRDTFDRNATESASEDEADEGFANILDALETQAPPPKRRRLACFQDPATTAILQALSRYPDLLSTYVDQLDRIEQETQDPASSTTAGVGPSRMPNTQSVGANATGNLRSRHTFGDSVDSERVSPSTMACIFDLLPTSDLADRQHRFRPTRAQQDVHRAITAPYYAGKNPDDFMDHARNSTATKFMPHPAVLSRLYEFQFGTCVNLQNFSPALNLPEPPRSPHFTDLVDAISVLDVYASEFFNDTTSQFICDDLRELAPWSEVEVKGLAFWLGKVFGAFRLAVVNDLANDSHSRHQVMNRFSLQDGELNGILLKLSRSARHLTRELVTSTKVRRERPHSKGKSSKIPPEVLRHIPKLGGRQLCLMFVSKRGCSSDSSDRCTQSFLTHFSPETLHPNVQKYVKERTTRPARLQITRAVVDRIIHLLKERLVSKEEARGCHRRSVAKAARISCPCNDELAQRPQDVYQLDMAQVRTISQLISQLVVKKNLSLEETIRLWRGQSIRSPQPNKALSTIHYPWLLHGYKHLDLMMRTATHGVTHYFRSPTNLPPQKHCGNHKSASEMSKALYRSIREGQNDGSYLLVLSSVAKMWSELHYSPFGCVAKAGCDPQVEARVIHDLSYPRGASTNAWSDQNDIPDLSYEHVAGIAHRIIHLRRAYPTALVKLLKGDVKHAFRNLHVREDVCAHFVGELPEAGVIVIDLALPFGWTSSPAHYGVFGGAITHLVRRESPHSLMPSDHDAVPFFCFNWVDDHVPVEPDIGSRLTCSENALRLAMAAVLGPRAINDKKISLWTTKLTALGLEWNTEGLTVSMPNEKIAKALNRVDSVLLSEKVTRTGLDELLGSLRHGCVTIFPEVSISSSEYPTWDICKTKPQRAPRFTMVLAHSAPRKVSR